MTQNKFKKIFVGGLPPQTTENDMRHYFSKYGDVCDVVAMRDKAGNKSRGFGFVVFKEEESVDRCQAERPHRLLGKVVDTKRAMPKEESLNPDIHCNSKRIFIGGIRRFFTEDDLREYFRNFGEIVDCTIKRDNVSGQSRGFAFITFTDRDIVDKVILSKPHSIKHCIVDVKKAMTPEELRQIDENHNNNIDYESDYQRSYKANQDTADIQFYCPDDDMKMKDKTAAAAASTTTTVTTTPTPPSTGTNKHVIKQSQSYPPSEYSSYVGYYILPQEMNGISSPSPAVADGTAGTTGNSHTYSSYDHATVPIIWMSVQQFANGYFLTPISPDIYSAVSYPSSYLYHSPISPQLPNSYSLYSPATFFNETSHHHHGNGNSNSSNCNNNSNKYINNNTVTNNNNNNVMENGTSDKSDGLNNFNELKKALPTDVVEKDEKGDLDNVDYDNDDDDNENETKNHSNHHNRRRHHHNHNHDHHESVDDYAASEDIVFRSPDIESLS